ncbi:hypothetical protein U1Q18_017552 [Sarracenia purpurea var. burkii]
MDGRESKGASPADLLVCFPSRAHLSLMMPKPICGPAKPSEPTKRRHHHHHHHHFNKSSNRGPGGAARPTESEIAEPTSPRVSCAGKIKVRPKHGSCKNWQSVMEEIERLHNHRRRKKRANTAEVFGFKREIVHFLSCLRQVRFDFRCFRAFLATDLSSDDDEEEEDEDYQEKKVGFDGNESSGTEFSWFVALQEEQSKRDDSQKEETFGSASGPPPNALSLMRCRSAPAKSWLENEGSGGGGGGKEREDGGGGGDGEAEREEGKLEEKRNKTLAMLMREDADFCTFSSEIAKETWVVGDLRDLLVPRSRSWKI